MGHIFCGLLKLFLRIINITYFYLSSLLIEFKKRSDCVIFNFSNNKARIIFILKNKSN